MAVDLRLPTSWRRHIAWTSPHGFWMIAAALSFRSYMVGFEIINGDAKGCALVIGPIWLGIARLSRENTNPKQRRGSDG